MGVEVPRVRTPLTELQMLEALREGHRVVFGVDPSPSRLACAWAQCALEHGRGNALDNFCLGNVTCGKSWEGKHYTLRCNERIKRDPDVWKVVELWFRAFDNATDGASNYWRLIAGRFSRVLPYFDRADVLGAAHVLSVLVWYTALESQYASAMLSLERYCSGNLIDRLSRPLCAEPGGECSDPNHDAAPKSSLDLDAINATVAASLSQLAHDDYEEARREHNEKS